MTRHSNSSEIMVKLKAGKRKYKRALKLLENYERKNLGLYGPHAKMDLNRQLICSLLKPVAAEKINHIQELLKRGADPNAIGPFGNRPLHLALINSPSNVPLVLELISFGAKVDVANNQGSTPLSFSVEKKCHRTTTIFLKTGVNLNFQCDRGWTFLMIASMVGDHWSARALLEHGANVNACDKRNRTALKFAVDGNYYKVIKVLLAYGANPAIKHSAKTILCIHLQKKYPNLDIAHELLLHCASFTDLKDNTDVSFVKAMKSCLRGDPPDYACARTVIKIQELITYDRPRAIDFGVWSGFANDCHFEVRFMQCHFVNQFKNVRTLLLRCLEGKMPAECELEALLPLVANNKFPFYSEILKAQLHKPFLRKKYLNTLMYAKKEDSKDKIVSLNYDVNVKILSYLSDDDMTNFVLGSYIKIDSEEKSCK